MPCIHCHLQLDQRRAEAKTQNITSIQPQCARYRDPTTIQHQYKRSNRQSQNSWNTPKPSQRSYVSIESEKNYVLQAFQTTKYKVHLAYHSMYTKSLQFPLGVAMMSYDMANSISKRTTQAVMGAMNVNLSLPRTLAFAGTKLLGLGLHHHYCVQGITHCKQIIQHLQQQDKNGKMHKMIFKYGQLLARVQYPILQNPKPRLPHINNPMITTICQFLAESQLNIVIPGLYSPQPLQENNHNIMGELMKIEKSPIAVQRVNQC
jgi:hypothetical protein